MDIDKVVDDAVYYLTTQEVAQLAAKLLNECGNDSMPAAEFCKMLRRDVQDNMIAELAAELLNSCGDKETAAAEFCKYINGCVMENLFKFWENQ